jgi:hypothetical protein
VACWSHVRRKFYDVHHAVASATALEAMQRIAALFAIESRIRGQSPKHRLVVRQQHARPLLDQLKKFLDTALGRISGKSTLAQAIRYGLSRWPALERYLTDGRLEMSNNAAERAMKSPVLEPRGVGAGALWRSRNRRILLLSDLDTMISHDPCPRKRFADDWHHHQAQNQG